MRQRKCILEKGSSSKGGVSMGGNFNLRVYASFPWYDMGLLVYMLNVTTRCDCAAFKQSRNRRASAVNSGLRIILFVGLD